MQMTEQQKVGLQARLEAQAAAYAADPQKGLDAGYQPQQVPGFEPSEIGRPGRRTNMRSNHAAWLYGIAQKDLPSGTWRIDEGMGDGPGSSSLIIL